MKSTTILWSRLGFLFSPEDSSEAGEMRPEWVTPACSHCKALVWIAVSIVAAIILGKL